MGLMMEKEIERWTARGNSALVLEVIQGKTIVAEVSRQLYLDARRWRIGWTTPRPA